MSRLLRYFRHAVGSLALCAGLSLAVPAAAQIGVPEIAQPGLPDIAMVTLTPQGPVILYNPVMCAQFGPALCDFYRYHEYGHVVLGHAYAPNRPQQNEADADCWAGANAPPISVQAAIQWFMSGGGSGPVHGPGPVRAQRVLRCAGFPGF